VSRSAGEALKDIRTFTRKFGVVTSIKAYWDRNKRRPAEDALYAVMPSMGVNLVDSSSIQGYTNDALIKMLSGEGACSILMSYHSKYSQVDVVMSAMDDPIATGTSEHNIILIISGDRSVLYPISLLMFRNYTVFLAVPDDDTSTQSFQASKVFNWRRDVLGYPDSATVSIPEASKSSNNGWITNGSHIPQLSLDSSSVGISSSSAISPCSECISSPKPATIVTSPAITPGCKDKYTPSSEPFTRAPSVLSLSSDPRGTSKSIVNFGTAASEINASVQEFSTTLPQTSDTTYQMPDQEQNSDPVGWAQDDWIGGWNEGGGWEMADSNWSSDTTLALQTSKKSSPQVNPSRQETKPLAQRKAWGQGYIPGLSRENNVPARKNEIKGPSTRNPPKSVFKPLVEILQGLEKRSMMRSQLGEHLAKCKNLYQSAGVSGFGEFIALAAKNNVIIIHGNDNHQQVKLKK